jgi:NADH:ubiquinone oxidoreductase subunit 5 (subunit L)/multisubunit Na+/H+ antiporter MnhA subunit
MEGPTPVSALLHAATMVTAGIFLLYRILPIFLLDPEIYRYIGYIGIITIIIGGLIGLYQNDIKRIIAFSTCSQLGYMFYSAAIGLYNLSFFHLIIHGFFKSLLFIIAGILIHGNKNEQDIRKYGGYIFSYPLSYIFFFIGTLSITSFPFYSGFYSKDILIENSYFSFFEIYLFSLLGVILTISYSLRILYLIFYNKPNSLPNQILPNDYFSYF